ncbi:Uncharacterized protein APZ42_013475 [Daphnia magna]|uniref:Uncharacterized protein n=1 Tax=Daphnia magna TaxID=35525 RepID=A0A162QUT7_9CRUS|nr:Uncharacterized protein APZ42_013475 [Daphnia magna]
MSSRNRTTRKRKENVEHSRLFFVSFQSATIGSTICGGKKERSHTGTRNIHAGDVNKWLLVSSSHKDKNKTQIRFNAMEITFFLKAI